MASSCRGASCTKPSKGVFRTHSYIQDGAFAKIVNDFRCLAAKVCKNATFNKLSEILHKFVRLLLLKKKIVALKAASYSNPISNFRHLQLRSLLVKLQIFRRVLLLSRYIEFWTFSKKNIIFVLLLLAKEWTAALVQD